MIIVVNYGNDIAIFQGVVEYLEAQGLRLHFSEGTERTIIGLVGATQ